MSEPAQPGGEASRWPILLLTLGFLLLMGVAGLTAWMAQENRRQNEDIEHTLEVRATIAQLLTELLNAETGQRGFLLVGRPEYYRVYQVGSQAVPVRFARLSRLTADNARQQGNLSRIAPIVRERLQVLTLTTELARSGRVEQAADMVRSGRGKLLMDKLRAEIARIDAEEARLLGVRRARAEATVDRLMLASVSGLLIAAALGIAAILSLLRYSRGLERANAEVRAFNESLEASVQERTADLQAANDEIQRFAYIVSHDLRSPLVNVMGFTSELEAAGGHARALLDKVEAERPGLASRDEQLAVREDLPEALGFIRTSTAKMDRLINAILKLSREGRRNIAAERIDLTRMMEDIVSALHQQVEAAGATITVTELPGVTSDRLALEQIFSNLVENAVKYRADDRPAEIRVTGQTAGASVIVSIEDNGRGIDSADRERVFDLFRRAGVQDRPGEGIGLAHVRALVRRLGGTIEVESELGRGSCFTVTLPRELKESAAE